MQHAVYHEFLVVITVPKTRFLNGVSGNRKVNPKRTGQEMERNIMIGILNLAFQVTRCISKLFKEE